MQQVKKYIRQIVNEELNKGDVRSMIDGDLDDFIKERRFKKAVRDIVSDVFEDFFQQMWQKKNFWKGGLKNG